MTGMESTAVALEGNEILDNIEAAHDDVQVALERLQFLLAGLRRETDTHAAGRVYAFESVVNDLVGAKGRLGSVLRSYGLDA